MDRRHAGELEIQRQQDQNNGPRHLHHKLERKEERHGQGHLMVGKAVARRQSGIELQGETHAGCQHQRQKLQRENGAVDGVVGGHLLEQLGENTRQIRQEAHVEGRHKNRQEHHHAGGDEPHGGDDQLAPHMLVNRGGQSEHDVALVPQQIFVEPLEHQNERHNEHGGNGHHIGHDHQSGQHIQHKVA